MFGIHGMVHVGQRTECRAYRLSRQLFGPAPKIADAELAGSPLPTASPYANLAM
jgi:hypothetical protein